MLEEGDHISTFYANRALIIYIGPLEYTVNFINPRKRKVYGLRDLEFFKLKILAIHETKYALVG